jgi:hypothetical protein
MSMKAQLKKLGLDIYGGCRCSLVNEVMENYGISIDEIIAKLDDDTVIRAVYKSLEVSGVLAEANDDDEWKCNRCNECEGDCLCEEND